MKHLISFVIILSSCCCLSCAKGQAGVAENGNIAKEETTTTADSTAYTRFDVPKGYKRVETNTGSFAEYLRTMPLKPRGTDLRYYNGTIKSEHYDGGVADLDFGYQSTNQCADAVIFLRAMYLWQQKRYNEIHFNFTNGFRADYSRWANGDRIVVNTKTWHCSWVHKKGKDYSYPTFRKYLDIVFNYAGTLSLEKELTLVKDNKIEIGDVLINGGSPGHTVIVVDKAVSTTDPTDAVYLLAQSFMPAQEIEIFNKWFHINPNEKYFESPSWVFKGNYHRRFANE